MHPLAVITAFAIVNQQILFLLFPTYSIKFSGIQPISPTLYSSLSSTTNQDDTTCINPKGIIHEAFLESKIYQAPVKYSIYLPPCYIENSTARYPAIYLLHGQTYDNTQWARLGLVDVADALINKKQIPPIIIIMPNDPDWRQPSESPFGRMLVEELIPHVDEIYPTRVERQYRAIGGLSRGASWALHLGLTEWKLFSRIGAHSLPVFISDDDNIVTWLDAIPYQSIPQLYIDTGNQDPELNIARNFEKLLSTRHIPHDWHMYTGTHEDEYWSGHIEKYLFWYACDWTVLLYN